MKRLLMLSLLLATATSYAAEQHEECATDDTVKAQASALLKVAEKIEADGCPAPKPTDYKAFCDSISIQEKPTNADKEYFSYGYEKRLMDLSCADVSKEPREVAAEKVSKMWSKYNKNFRCQSSTFNVEKGSVLKFAVVQGFAPFLETIVGTYQMDINFVDPADNKNVLDYVNAELKKALATEGPNHPRVKVLKEYKELLQDLGAIPSK